MRLPAILAFGMQVPYILASESPTMTFASTPTEALASMEILKNFSNLLIENQNYKNQKYDKIIENQNTEIKNLKTELKNFKEKSSTEQIQTHILTQNLSEKFNKKFQALEGIFKNFVISSRKSRKEERKVHFEELKKLQNERIIQNDKFQNSLETIKNIKNEFDRLQVNFDNLKNQQNDNKNGLVDLKAKFKSGISGLEEKQRIGSEL